MPDCSENYEKEISDGKNARNIKCKYCNSVILTPSTAAFTSFEVRNLLLNTVKNKLISIINCSFSCH